MTVNPVPYYREGSACITCRAHIVAKATSYGGEPGLTQDDLDQGRVVAMNCAPYGIKRLQLECENGHVFDVASTSYEHDERRFTFKGSHLRLDDDFVGLTAPGWPRPRYRLRFQPKSGNYVDRVVPVPWVTPVPQFAKTDPGRRKLVVDYKLCQICGLAHAPGSEVIVFLNGGLRARPEDARMDLQNYRNVILRSIDDAVMHERCARLAAGVCPKLKAMSTVGDLWAFAGPIESIEAYEDPNEVVEVTKAMLEQSVVPIRKLREYLAMTGRDARIAMRGENDGSDV